MATNSEPIRIQRFRDAQHRQPFTTLQAWESPEQEQITKRAVHYHDRMVDILDALAHGDSTMITPCIENARALLWEMGQQ